MFVRIGDKVKLSKVRLIELSKNEPERAKMFKDQIGVITGFDDVTWHYIVKFGNQEFSIRKYNLEHVKEN